MTAASLHARARAINSRRLVRGWEFRQRDRSSGVWARLRLALAMTERAFAIDEAIAIALEREGFAPLPVGLELAPASRLYVIPAGRADELSSTTPLPLRIGDPLLHAGFVVLVPFSDRPSLVRVES